MLGATTLRLIDIQPKRHLCSVSLIINYYAKCRYAECRYAECRSPYDIAIGYCMEWN